jgi:electron transfer flavoprotein beta subunit
MTMKVLVAVKRVVDYNVKVRPKSDGTDVDLANVKMSINPFCEIAVEEAVRLKEKAVATEIIAVTVGSQQSQEQLRTALALGADRAILVLTEDALEPLGIAKCLKAVCDSESPDVILMGKQAIDGDNNQTGQMLGALMGVGQATFASELTIDGATVSVTREVDGGLQTLSLPLPAIVTADLRLNEPRYASLPNIMKAKKKPLETITPEDLGVDVSPRVALLGVELPEERQAGIKVEDVAQLIDKLKNEAKVI